MFTIDLLKGKALPEKVDLKKSTLRALLVMIPVLALSLLAVAYNHTSASAQTLQQTLRQQQQQFEQYTGEMAEYNRTRTQIKEMEKCLQAIAKALTYRLQVSDILTELVQTLPETIFLYEIKMGRNAIEKKIQQGDKLVKKLSVQRKLDLVLCGFDPQKSDRAVQTYLGQLEQSPLLSEIFTEIKPSARQQGQVDKRDAIYYEIECVLREQE